MLKVFINYAQFIVSWNNLLLNVCLFVCSEIKLFIRRTQAAETCAVPCGILLGIFWGNS